MKHRCGWMLLETIVSVALLLMAAVAAVRLAGAQRAFRESSRQTLAASIACDNAAEWLRRGSVGSVDEDIELLTQSPLGEGLRIQSTPFIHGSFTGAHIRITPQVDLQPAVVRDVWRLQAADDLGASDGNAVNRGDEDAS